MQIVQKGRRKERSGKKGELGEKTGRTKKSRRRREAATGSGRATGTENTERKT